MSATRSSEDEESRDEKKEERKVKHISVGMLVKMHLPPEAKKWDQDEILTSLQQLTHIRLDRQNIAEIESLEEFCGQSATNVYLQHNIIKKIECLSGLVNLRFLTLADNHIEDVENLTKLSNLQLLDLSNNRIESFDIDEFPQSLIILSLLGNPCCNMPDYRGRIIQDLPKLRQLDGETVTKIDRKEVGYVVSSSEEEEEEEDEEVDEDIKETAESTVETIFRHTASDIINRSHARVEEMMQEHKRHSSMLSEIRHNQQIQFSIDSARSLVSQMSIGSNDLSSVNAGVVAHSPKNLSQPHTPKSADSRLTSNRSLNSAESGQRSNSARSESRSKSLQSSARANSSRSDSRSNSSRSGSRSNSALTGASTLRSTPSAKDSWSCLDENEDVLRRPESGGSSPGPRLGSSKYKTIPPIGSQCDKENQ